MNKQQQFNFEDSVRCKQYTDIKQRHLTKTGTTIVGLVFNDGVIVCADQRASAGHFVADKHCKKLFQLAENMVCAGAGTAADAQNVKMMVSDELKLLNQTYNLKPQVGVAQTLFVNHLFRYGGNISAALICGGYDIDGPHIVAINPEGSYDHVPYATLGSGSLAAQSILDTYYKDNLTQEEAVQLGIKAITAGIINDEGSGSAVDMAVITKDKCVMYRSIVKPGDESAVNWQLYK